MSLRRQAEALFSRHLDLRPLHQRRRGSVRCRFHDDRTASLSVDLDRGLFNCFGCGEHGGVRRFAELVGEVAERRPRTTPSTRNRERLSAQIRDAALRQAWARDGVAELYELSDHLRYWRRFIEGVRRGAAQESAPWDLLQLAARVEQEAYVLEGYLDRWTW